MELEFSMNNKKEQDYKQIICPCCNKQVEIPVGVTGINFNYSTLINDREYFFDLVDICLKCGCVMLFDNSISEEMKEYIKSEEYTSILNNDYLELGFKKWLLLAFLCEEAENYTEAGIAYTKAYDYLELKGMELDHRLIKKASSCFLATLESNPNFIDAFMAIDSLRRDGDMEAARSFHKAVSESFSGELPSRILWREDMWIDLNNTEKYYLDI